MSAFEGVLVGNGLPFSQSQWAPIESAYTPPANAIASDFTSEGYEARITTNITRNWRLVANYSYTDSGRTNLANEMIAWYGLKPADGVRLVQGVTQNANGLYVVNPHTSPEAPSQSGSSSVPCIPPLTFRILIRTRAA